MSREIKFRVWHLLNKKMLNWGDIFDLPAWEIFPGTPEQRAFNVMQYTGLKDKNGVEIYEGDILKDTLSSLGIVKFIDGSYRLSSNYLGLSINVFSDADYLSEDLVDDNDLETIGNIYQNPELLERGE